MQALLANYPLPFLTEDSDQLSCPSASPHWETVHVHSIPVIPFKETLLIIRKASFQAFCRILELLPSLCLRHFLTSFWVLESVSITVKCTDF